MCRTPLIVPPLVELAGYRPLQAVYLGSQTAVPGDLPLSPQPVLQAYLILNVSRYGGRVSSGGRLFGVEGARAFGTAPKSQRTCPLPSRYAVPCWTEFLLLGGSGSLSSQCARS
jgi:hypothetical protein